MTQEFLSELSLLAPPEKLSDVVYVGEPSLGEILGDPVMQMMMACDQVAPGTLMDLLANARASLGLMAVADGAARAEAEVALVGQAGDAGAGLEA